MAIQSWTSDDGRSVVIRVSGRFDFSHHQSFRASYQDADPASTRFKIDLSDTEYIDSSALGMLLLLRERAGGDRARISLLGCQPEVCKILKVSRFHQLFNIEGSPVTPGSGNR